MWPCAALLALLTASCEQRVEHGPIGVVAIGGAPILADPSRGPLDTPQRLLAASVGEGLVRFDAAGQIEPGLAERWTVIDNGMSYIFRLRPARWPDGKPILAGEVAAMLRHQLARGSRNALAPFLSAVSEVVEMTPEVVEVRLARPRPDLLKLFAQPELAILKLRPAGGGGPFRASGGERGVLTLRPDVDPAIADEDAVPPGLDDQVRLSGGDAARAIVRFTRGRIDLVTGGTFTNWPLLAAASAPAASVRVDPAAGLLGLAITSREGFLADPANRDALSSIVDRAAIAALFGGLTPTEQLAPDALDSTAPPSVAAWSTLPLGQRRANARARIMGWQALTPGPLLVRVALPQGPGANLLWGQIGAALIGVGIAPVRVALDAPAELRLVDAVAPYDSARWYLATACQPCGADAQAKLDAAREAPTPQLRAQALALADQAIAADSPFIPIARPLRWSLVGPRLREWQPNSRAWHPLNHLRPAPR